MFTSSDWEKLFLFQLIIFLYEKKNNVHIKLAEWKNILREERGDSYKYKIYYYNFYIYYKYNFTCIKLEKK